MEILRTPEERFVDLDGFDYPAHYVPVGDGLRMAYVQAGPSDGPPVLLLHGEPSWSYLYRHMLPILADAGLRATVPDLIGFGRSDKPAAVEEHSYARHVGWVRALLESLELTGITLVGQDWGGLIGLRLVAETDRLAAVVAANTGLPTGDHDMPEVWHRFRRAVRDAPHLDVARFIQSGCRSELNATVRASYDAPFPDESYKAGRGQCRNWFHTIGTIRPPTPIAPPGNNYPLWTPRRWSRSPTTTRSPAAWHQP